MEKYKDCNRCGSMSGQAIFSLNELSVWAYLCEECYNLCKFHHQPERSKREDLERGCGALNSMET